MKYGFGIDVGGTTVKLACLREDGHIEEKWEIPTDTAAQGKNILPDIAASVKSYLCTHNLPTEDILGIGVGVPGPVNSQGTVNRCVNLGWGVLDVAGELEKCTGLRVKVGNDATVAAVGESWLGGGKGYGSMVLITLGTGVGGGLVLDGRPVHGAHGAGGEIGHICLNFEETEVCSCGKYGCAEQYCSATGIVRLAKQALASTDAPSSLRDLSFMDAKAVMDAAKSGDAIAMQAMEKAYDYMARLIGTVCSAYDPEAVVLGGGVSKAGAVLTDNIARFLPKYIFHAASGVELRLAELGNDAGVCGAFRLLL